MTVLIFQLYGVLTSWGEIAVGEVRRSSNHPSRSALLGLLSAALGIERTEEEKLQSMSNYLRFAVRMDCSPRMMRDYHTTQSVAASKLKKRYVASRREELLAATNDERNTILSTREYYADSCYTVAVWIESGVDNDFQFSLAQTATALQKPVFVLYLGRKSCTPGLPLYPQLIEATTIIEAMDKADFKREQLKHKGEKVFSKLAYPESIQVWWDHTTLMGIEHTNIFTRRDDPRSRTAWQFGERFEYHAMLPAKTQAQGGEHD